MTTLRVRLAAPPSPERADEWALFDAADRCVRAGSDRPSAWPGADRFEIVVAASQLRIASVALPTMPSSRVAAAAAFALEDQLAGPLDAHRLVASPQAADGTVRVVVVARAVLDGIAGSRREIARILAEPDLATPGAGWRWCVADDGGFVRRADGSAFPVGSIARDGALPPELAVALAQAAREHASPASVRVDGDVADDDCARWRRDTGVAYARGSPWRWASASPAAFAAAIDLRPGSPAVETREARRAPRRAFALALGLAGGALALHVAATVGEWAWLRYEVWRDARAWTALAESAGVATAPPASPTAARSAITRRYAEARHAQGLAAPDDALPLLARGAPALATLPRGSVKSATYADGHWTLDVARAEGDAIRDLDLRMRAAGVPVLVARSGDGARLRFGGP